MIVYIKNPKENLLIHYLNYPLSLARLLNSRSIKIGISFLGMDYRAKIFVIHVLP